MRQEITNRSGLKLVIQVEESESPMRLVFIAHGFKGFRGQAHLQSFAKAFLENNFRVVLFDATHALGESEGEVIDASYDSYIADLEDVIEWSRKQAWFLEPFALCGHSMGAQSVAWYAEQYPERVSLLVPMAPPVNYDLYVNNDRNIDDMRRFQEEHYREETSNSKPGVVVKTSWGTVESIEKFDLLEKADNLTMPILDMVGEHDQPCPPSSQEALFSLIPSEDKTLIILPDLDHNYRSTKNGSYDDALPDIEKKLSSWLSAHLKPST